MLEKGGRGGEREDTLSFPLSYTELRTTYVTAGREREKRRGGVFMGGGREARFGARENPIIYIVLTHAGSECAVIILSNISIQTCTKLF